MNHVMTSAAALMLSASFALAGPLGLPDHEQDGYRDTGCDPAFQVDMGGYWNNPTCPMVGGSAAPLADLAAAFPAPKPDEEEPEDPPEEEPEDPVDPPTDPEDPPVECKGDCTK